MCANVNACGLGAVDLTITNMFLEPLALDLSTALGSYTSKLGLTMYVFTMWETEFVIILPRPMIFFFFKLQKSTTECY